MLEYIYFVKCPGCEDEHFSFFNEAKDFAMSLLSKKPIITQIEVDRNDFGECTDSCDLGTVWSWEDIMNTENDSTESVFTKDDLKHYDTDYDTEFDSLDNSLDPVNNFRRPIPADKSIKDLVEEMEENEDTVECKWCDELFDKSECRYEVDLGWLCNRCQAAIKSRGEELTFREGSLDEAIDPRDLVELEYPELTVTLYGQQRDADDWDEFEHTDSHVFLVPKVEIATVIFENWITEDDVKDIEGGLDKLSEDDAAWEQFVETHFDDLFEKYQQQILDYFKDEAEDDFRERSQEEYQMGELFSNEDQAYDEWRDSRFDESAQKSFLEEFDDVETRKAALIDCPECGTTSYNMKEQYCSNCGLGL